MKGVSTRGVSVWGGQRAPLRRVILYCFVSFAFLFLVLPNIIVVPLSVTDSIFLQFPPKGFTWKWYQDFFGVESATDWGASGRWIPATLVSVELALIVMIAAVPIGALAAYGLTRGRYRGKAIINAGLISPLIVPHLISSIAIFFFLSKSMRSFFQPLPAPDLSAGLEWLVVIIVMLLGLGAILGLLLPKFMRRPLTGRLLAIDDRVRPFFPFMLLIAVPFFLVTWTQGFTDPFPGGLFTAGNPIPSVPPISLALVLPHIMLSVPYVVIILSATLRSVDTTQDQASATLGAGPFTTLRRVILPAMIPGVAAAAFFAFLISFDELLIALFMSTTEISTLPKELWDGIRTEISPTIAAVSTMLVGVTVMILGSAVFFQAYLRKKSGQTE